MDYSHSFDDQVYSSSPYTSRSLFAETSGTEADRTPPDGYPHAVLSLHSLDGSIRNMLLLRGQPIIIARQVEGSTHIPNYIPCESMSRKHAEIWEDGEKVYIKDLGSTNGTFVNGKRLSQSASVSQAYELHINDTVEFGTNLRIDRDEKQSFVAHVTFAFSMSSVKQNQYIPPSEARPVPDEVMARITLWIGTKQDNEDVPILFWLTHPDDQERSAITHDIANYCAKSNILCSTMFLSQQAVGGWELATLFATQLCQSIPGLQLLDTQFIVDANMPFEDVDEEWIRTFFIEPLITHNPPPALIIIDPLDSSQDSFLKPLLALAALLQKTPQLRLKLMLTTHPEMRATADISQDLRDAHVLTEIHVLDTLDQLSRLMLYPPNVRRNALASVNQIIEYNNLFTCLSDALPDSSNAQRHASTPLETLLQITQFEKLLGQLIEDLKLTQHPEFNEILAKDKLVDQATHVKILRDVVLSAEADRSTIRLLQGGDAQLLVDFCQELLDQGTLMSHHGHDFDRKTRRLVVKIATAADILPESVFIQSGIGLLEREPYSGGGFSDIFRASYGGEKMALKRLRVYRNNHDRARINRKFCREALTWRPLEHPNVLPFVGVDANSFPGYLCMISPWMEHGTLPDLRKRYGPWNIQIERRMYEVADGLEYLHFEKIIHGDLRGANILIDEHRHVRLADFGLTVFSDASIATHSEHGGCVRWMAPELFEPEGEEAETDVAMGPRKTEKTDIYAFACVYFEMYKGLAPFSEFNLDPPVIVRVSQGKRPDRPTDDGESVRIPSLAWTWVQRCWHQDPQKRPSMEVVKGEMQRWYGY